MIMNKISRIYLSLLGVLLAVSLHAQTDYAKKIVEKHTPDIRGRVQTIDVTAGRTTALDLQNYWRSNLHIKGSAISSEKRPKAQHVPGLVEYRVHVTNSGTYSIQLDADYSGNAPTHLTVDGELKATLFENPGNSKQAVKKVNLYKGLHYIRLTSAKLNTPVPTINSISLKLDKAKNIITPAPPAPIKTGIPSAAKKGWEYDVSRKIHLDFHTAAYVDKIGSKWNPDEFAATLADNGLNAVTVFAKGHHGFAFYNTKIGTVHPGLDFDLLKEQIEACHKRGIKVLAYFSVNVDELWATTEEGVNPNWEKFQQVDANPGKSYIKDYTWPMIREVVENYDIDGFWFDFPGYDEFVSQTIDLIRSIKPNLISAYNHQFDKPREEIGQTRHYGN